jgi:phosphoglycerate dehydrogenase-like enzyme
MLAIGDTEGSEVKMVRVGVDGSLDRELFKDFTKAVELVWLPPDLDRENDVDLLIAPFKLDRFKRLLPYLRGLKVIQCLWAGVDTILPLVPPGLTLCDARGVHDIPTAEWTVAVILAMQKYLPLYVDLQAKEDWQGRSKVQDLHIRMHKRPSAHPSARLVDEVADKAVLIVGYGSIGQAIEERLAPFGCKFLRVARNLRPGVHTVDQLDDLLPQADIIILITPLTSETKHLMDAQRIRKLKQGALLVNAGRGPVVDTDELVNALMAGKIRAALDVTDPEPLPPRHPLWKAPNLLITPHVAGSTERFIGRGLKFASEQAERYSKAESLKNMVVGGY